MPDEMHLCLSDLLDQDTTSYEYFNTLPNSVKEKLIQSDVRSFRELQAQAELELEALNG